MKQVLSISALLFITTIFISCKKDVAGKDVAGSPESITGGITSSNFTMVQTNTSLPYWQEIYNDKNFGKYSDTMARCIRGGGIVFVGNSLFNNWNIEWNYRTYPAINRAFGGSRWLSIPPFLQDVIGCYRPKQVVFYEGENELFAGKDAAQLFNDFKTVFEKTRSMCPRARITVLSLKPSPSQWNKNEIIKSYNSKVRKYLHGRFNTSYCDVYSLMLNSNGGLRPELYKSDGLHMTVEGYEIWLLAIKPYLLQ